MKFVQKLKRKDVIQVDSYFLNLDTRWEYQSQPPTVACVPVYKRTRLNYNHLFRTYFLFVIAAAYYSVLFWHQLPYLLLYNVKATIITNFLKRQNIINADLYPKWIAAYAHQKEQCSSKELGNKRLKLAPTPLLFIRTSYKRARLTADGSRPTQSKSVRNGNNEIQEFLPLCLSL